MLIFILHLFLMLNQTFSKIVNFLDYGRMRGFCYVINTSWNLYNLHSYSSVFNFSSNNNFFKFGIIVLVT